MKSRVKKFLTILIIILILLFIIKIKKKEHNYTYKIDNYSINEKFYISKKEHWYDIKINDKNNTYIFSLNEKVNKTKKLIKEIKTYKKNNLTCIVPIYKRNIDSNIYCNYNKKQVSNYYLLQEDNEDFKYILNKAKKYKININNSKSTKVDYKKLSFYKNNIPNNYKFIIWDYKGIYILSNDLEQYQKLLNYDLYDNLMNTIVGNYYVLFENTSVNGIEEIYYYDLKKNKLNKFKLKDKISKDSYINGIVNNLIYVTDNKEKKQYTIDIKKRKIEEINKGDNNYQKYENGDLKLLSKSDFFIKSQYFDNEIISDDIIKSENLKKEYNYYYYIEDDKMYKALNSYKKNPILLFELKDIKDWKIIDRDILLISEDTLYLYNEESGLNNVIKSNELKYNYKNIYNIWKK